MCLSGGGCTGRCGQIMATGCTCWPALVPAAMAPATFSSGPEVRSKRRIRKARGNKNTPVVFFKKNKTKSVHHTKTKTFKCMTCAKKYTIVQEIALNPFRILVVRCTVHPSAHTFPSLAFPQKKMNEKELSIITRRS